MRAKMTADSPWASRPEYSVRVTPEDLQTALARALATVRPESDFTADSVSGALIETPERADRGDWSSNIALRAAGSSAEAPRALAADLAAELSALPEVDHAEVAGPGFINITLTAPARAQIVRDLLTAGAGFGDPSEGAVTSGADRVAPEDIGRLQLSHAAACRTDRRARAAGIDTADFDPATLAEARGTMLINRLAATPGAYARSRRGDDAQAFTGALLKVAEAFEQFSSACRVTPTVDEPILPTHASRLALARAVISVLAAGLRQLGASAPERM